MNLLRNLERVLLWQLSQSGKMILLQGPKESGKSHLLQALIRKTSKKIIFLEGDSFFTYEPFLDFNPSQFKGLIAGHEIVFIDEAQKIQQLSSLIDLIQKHASHIKVFISSSTNLLLDNSLSNLNSSKLHRHLLLPVSIFEWKLYSKENDVQIEQHLENWLRFGMYPKTLLLTGHEDKKNYLRELTGSIIFKELFSTSQVRFPDKMIQLLKILAYQLGSTLSILELSENLDLNRDTVIHYLHILEKHFLIFRLKGFSKKLKKEMAKVDKFFFYDLGVRNALIQRFDGLDSALEASILWENFLLAERMKRNIKNNLNPSIFYWRTYTGAELNYVEEQVNSLDAFTFRLKKSRNQVPNGWKSYYPDSNWTMIHKKNYLDFIL